jgi:type-F conjugative transfer system pilin assembly protein TrbC
MATIRNYVSSIARLRDGNIMLVMRGFVDGMTKIGPTVRFSAEALKQNPLCEGPQCAMNPVNLIVDPLLFRRYGISRVPAVVYARGVHPATAGASEGDAGTGVASHYSIYGDASFEYMLEKISREAGSASLKGMVARR